MGALLTRTGPGISSQIGSTMETRTDTPPQRPAIPIRAKILALSLVLSMLMVIAVASDLIASLRADRRLDLLAEISQPLDKAIADARAFALSESLSVERSRGDPPAIRLSEAFASAAAINVGSCDAEPFRVALDIARKRHPHSGDRKLVDLGLLKACFETKIQSAAHFADSAAAHPSVADDMAPLASLALLRRELAEISLAHTEYHRSLAAFLEAPPGPELSRFLAEDVARRRSNLQRMLAQVLSTAQKSTSLGASESRRLSSQARSFSLAVAGMALFLSVLLSLLLSRQLTRPLLDLLSRAELLRRGDLSVRTDCRTRDEIALLSRAFDDMAVSLERDEAARRTFGKYLDPRVVERIVQEGRPDEPTRRPIAVSFCDMAKFTSISESLPTDALARLLERYFSLMCRPVHSSGGVVDKFIGDAVMSFWAPPFCDEPDIARLACHCVLEQIRALETLQGQLPSIIGSRTLVASVSVRFTIAFGEAVVGSIGSEDAKSFTAVGDTVNLASRLDGVSKACDSSSAVCNQTRSRAGDTFVFRELGRFRVVGRQEPETVHELLGEQPSSAGASLAELSRLSSDAHQLFRSRRFAEAAETFRACLAVRADDAPSIAMIARCQKFVSSAPPEGWDGALELLSK